MREVRGLDFADAVADVVEKLVERVEEQVGTTHLFSSQKHFNGCLKFALRLPGESKGSKANRIFAIIRRTSGFAIYHRPLPVKVGIKEIELTASTADEIFLAVMSGFYEAQKAKVPVEYQSTENPMMLAGGAFESNRSKF